MGDAPGNTQKKTLGSFVFAAPFVDLCVAVPCLGKEKKALALKEKSLLDGGHTLPSFADKTFELELRRVATKGVVRLFNTIKDHAMAILLESYSNSNIYQ